MSPEEVAYNKWWFSRFDEKDYKEISLFQHGKKIQTYTTANARYTDFEDAESAFWTASQMSLHITSVSVDGTRFKIINGKVRRIANG